MPPAALRPFRHRNYSVLWGASLVSNVGTWMQTVAVGALVTDITGQAAWTAVAYVAAFVPNGVLAPIGGALADRLDRRRWLAAGNVVEASLAGTLALLVASGRGTPALITIVVLVAGCVGALRMPFQQAMLPDLVPREDMVAAISLGSAQWNLGRVLGPALAGLVIALGSFSLAFAVNAASFFAVVVALAFVRLPRRTEHHEYPGLLRHIRDGAIAVRDEPGCRAAIELIALAALLAAPFMALIPAFAAMLVEGGAKATAGATGAMTTAQGVGAVAGALLLATLAERFGRGKVLVFDLIATPVAIIVYAFAPSVPIAIPLLAIVGGLYIGILSGLSAVMQLRAPEAYRGRILSLFFTTLSVVFPIGALAQGAIADRIGLRQSTIGAAVLMLAVVAAIRAVRPELLDALDDEELHADAIPVVTEAGQVEHAAAAG